MNTNAHIGLGNKSSTAPSSLVGTEAIFTDLEYDAADKANMEQLSNNFVHAIWIKQTGVTAIAPGSIVKWGVPGESVAAVAGSGEVGCGIVDPYLSSSVAQNEYFWMIFRGPVKVLSSTSISANAPVGTAASGQSVTSNYSSPALQTVFGRQIDAATGSAQLRRTLVNFQWI